MTNWNKTTDVSTSFTKTSDVSTSYDKTTDKDTNWGFFGGLIRLVTEGARDELMSEGRLDYLVYSHGEDVEIWTDTADVTTSYTKISDI